LINPARFADRKPPKVTRPLGKPYASMTEVEVRYWEEFAGNCSWLHASHRVLLRGACQLAARFDAGEVGISAIQALGALLSKLGATPVDETKVAHPDDDDDADDEFFGRPN
jgi:hypothetical protein